MPIVFCDESERLARLTWYKSGRDPQHFPTKSVWFPPDCMENVKVDASTTHNVTVFTSEGLPVFGRVLINATGRTNYVLNECWQYLEN